MYIPHICIYIWPIQRSLNKESRIPRTRPHCNYQIHFEVYLGYVILQLYQEHGAMLLVMIEASTVSFRFCRRYLTYGPCRFLGSLAPLSVLT